jgi:hypothetical protein
VGFVHPVETSEKPGEMLCGDFTTVILYRQNQIVSGGHPVTSNELASLKPVSHNLVGGDEG